MLGISIYPEKETVKDIKNYIDLAAKYGFGRVFTCLLSVSDTKENIIKNFKELINYATDHKMEVILDISPRVFNELGISYDDLSFFKQMGATGIRLDMGFDGQKESQLTFNPHDLDIEINMSSGTKYVDNIMTYRPNVKKLIASHNFYPMEFSGLSLEHFIKTSKQFKDLGIRTACFISSEHADHGPWPVIDNLCSLEIHRNLPITTQVKHLKLLNLIDDYIIANSFASEAELKAISEIDKSNLISFDIKLSKQNSDIENIIIKDEKHFNRGDTSDYLIRSTQSRVKYKAEDFKPHDTSLNIKKGDIIIGNNNFGQYKGELQLVKMDHPDKNKRKNVVAKVVEHELFLIDCLPPWSSFKFNIVK